MGELLKILVIKWAVKQARAYKIVGTSRDLWPIDLFACFTAHLITKNSAHTIPKFTLPGPPALALRRFVELYISDNMPYNPIVTVTIE
jgi:hypothetical protein